jgi:VWFA-related protein
MGIYRRIRLLAGLVVVGCALTGLLAWGQQTTDPFTGETGNAAQRAPDITLPQPQTTEEEHGLVIRSRTVLVQVPAIVTEKSGAHVHGLDKADFRILENGKQQKIAICEEVIAGTGGAPHATSSNGTFSNITRDGQRAPITIIVLDSINTPFLDQANGRRQLIKYLSETLGSARNVGLVAIGSKGVIVLHGINGDTASLIAALKKVAGEPSSMETFTAEEQFMAGIVSPSDLLGGTGPGTDPGQRLARFIMHADAVEASFKQPRAVEDTMKAFLQIAWSVAGVPGRKSLIWLTGSFPFDLNSPAAMPGDGLASLYARTMEALNDAQISVYPVDVRGLVSNFGITTSSYQSVSRIDANAMAARTLLDSSLDSMQSFAEMTGGRAYFGNSDLVAGIQRAVDDSSSYYLLSYYGDSHDTQAGWRKLRVEVSRKGVQVRARTGYLVTKITGNPQLTHNADIGFALSSPLDSTGLQVTLHWKDPILSGNNRRVGFALQVPAEDVLDEADQNRFDVDFIMQASRNGASVGQAAQTVRGAIPANALAKIKAEGFLYNNDLNLAPGDYEVRFVVRDNLSGKIGSVSAPLTVK